MEAALAGVPASDLCSGWESGCCKDQSVSKRKQFTCSCSVLFYGHGEQSMKTILEKHCFFSDKCEPCCGPRIHQSEEECKADGGEKKKSDSVWTTETTVSSNSER